MRGMRNGIDWRGVFNIAVVVALMAFIIFGLNFIGCDKRGFRIPKAPPDRPIKLKPEDLPADLRHELLQE